MTADKKPIGFYAATALVIANMVGTGVFTSLGYQVFDTKTVFALLMLWVVGGIIAFCGAVSYSELGAAMPRSGGEYHYLSKIFHPSLGFLSGWISVIAGFGAPIAAAAMALGGYVNKVYPGLNDVYVGAVVVVLITLVHSFDVKKGANFQLVFTIIKVLLIIVFIGCGFFASTHQSISILPAETSWKEIFSGSFAVSLVYVSYAYSGWNASAYVAGEIDNPQRNLPRSILQGTFLVMILYVLVNFIFLYTTPIPEIMGQKEVGFFSAGHIFGETGGNIMSMIISMLLISTISSMVLAGPRVTQMIGQDLPSLKVLAITNKKRVPFVAILLQSTIALILIFTSKFDTVVTYLGFTLSLFTTLTVIGLFVLRIKKPDLPRPYKTWGYPVTPVIFIALNIWVMYFLIDKKPIIAAYGFGTILVGLVFYYLEKMLSGNKNENQNNN